MKKLWLMTYATAAFLATATMVEAQQQQQDPSNEYRTTPPVAEQDTTNVDQQDTTNVDQQDTTAIEGERIRQGNERPRNEMEQGSERTGGENYREEEDTTRQETQGVMNEPVQDNSTQPAQDNSAQPVQDNSTQPARDNSMQPVRDNSMQSNREDTTGVNAATSSNNADSDKAATGTIRDTPADRHEVEVVEDKEGPNNEVVYKYQDGLYYVDRNQKKLVKADESQLKASKSKPVIIDGTVTNKDSKPRNKKSKG